MQKIRPAKKITAIMVLATLIFIVINPVYSDIWDPFHSKEEKINLWMQLWDSCSDASYECIGKTYNGKEIWLFKIGNPEGNKILWDGEMHGNEDKGSEVMYFIAQWLLEDNNHKAGQILANNFLMFIPILNVDSYNRGNMNTEECPYGVNLNRNFETGWKYGGLDPANPPHSDYSGAFPASEPETLALLHVFDSYRPDFYVNLHVGSKTPFLAYYNEGNTTLALEVIKQINQESQEIDVSPYRAFSIGSEGFSIGDANNYGISSWLLELEGEDTAWKHTTELYQQLEDEIFPKCLAIFLAMCENPQTTIESCDGGGIQKNMYKTNETIYVQGEGFSGSAQYQINLVEDTAWTIGMTIPTQITGTTQTIFSNIEGKILPTVLWNSTVAGNYDLVIDINGNGIYENEIDILCDTKIEVISESTIPEYTEMRIFVLFLVTTFFASAVAKQLYKKGNNSCSSKK
jgi:hypothetical protein